MTTINEEIVRLNANNIELNKKNEQLEIILSKLKIWNKKLIIQRINLMKSKAKQGNWGSWKEKYCERENWGSCDYKCY